MVWVVIGLLAYLWFLPVCFLVLLWEKYQEVLESVSFARKRTRYLSRLDNALQAREIGA